jgi:hypothetical protein
MRIRLPLLEGATIKRVDGSYQVLSHEGVSLHLIKGPIRPHPTEPAAPMYIPWSYRWDTRQEAQAAIDFTQGLQDKTEAL